MDITIDIKTDCTSEISAINRASKYWHKEYDKKPFELKGNHYVFLKGPIIDDLVIIRAKMVDDKIVTSARKCANGEHTEYIKNKWKES